MLSHYRWGSALLLNPYLEWKLYRNKLSRGQLIKYSIWWYYSLSFKWLNSWDLNSNHQRLKWVYVDLIFWWARALNKMFKIQQTSIKTFIKRRLIIFQFIHILVNKISLSRKHHQKHSEKYLFIFFLYKLELEVKISCYDLFWELFNGEEDFSEWRCILSEMLLIHHLFYKALNSSREMFSKLAGLETTSKCSQK